MEAIDVDSSRWRVRVERALRRTTARRGTNDDRRAGTAQAFEDQLVGHFGWTRGLVFDDIEHWLDVLAEHPWALGRPPQASDYPVLASASCDAARFDELGDAWHAACYAVLSGVRVVAFVRHWLPIWRFQRSEMCAELGEFRGVPYAAVASRHLLRRCKSPPFGLFTLPAGSGGRYDDASARLARKLEALEASLDHAGSIFRAAGCTLDAIRRGRDPGRPRVHLAEMAALAAPPPTESPSDRPS